jgi:hypothetical protein
MECCDILFFHVFLFLMLLNRLLGLYLWEGRLFFFS